MKRLTLFVFAFVCAFNLIAQTDFSFQDYGNIHDSSKSTIGIWGEIYYNSNVLNNSVFYNSVFQSGITRQSMQNMETKVMKNNIAGTQETERLYFSWKAKNQKDSSKLIHTINVSTRRSVNLKFGKEAFLLAGFGNKRFAGSAANVDDMEVNLMQFTQIQYGFIKEREGKISYGVGLAFVMGNKYGKYGLDNSYLYTSDIGDSVSGRLNGTLILSDTSSKNIYDVNGYGSAIDAFVSIPVNFIKKHDASGSIKIELNEFGFISWKNTLQYNIDGQMNWAGIKAPSVFDVGDSVYRDQVPSDLQSEFVESTNTSNRTTFMAPRIAIYYTEKLNDKIELRNSIDYRFNSNYLPFISSSQILSISKKEKAYQYYFNIHESLGGYGFFGAGIGLLVEHKKFAATVGTRNLIAMSVPEILGGFNLHFGFKWNFR